MNHTVATVVADPLDVASLNAAERELTELLDRGYKVVSSTGTASAMSVRPVLESDHRHRITWLLVKEFA